MQEAIQWADRLATETKIEAKCRLHSLAIFSTRERRTGEPDG
jgi:hypothetical protein